jgi:NADH:ubiquinone oxidoreductase subunit B-like Fe-S oxidoreductase
MNFLIVLKRIAKIMFFWARHTGVFATTYGIVCFAFGLEPTRKLKTDFKKQSYILN